jgi:D-alanyl-D-alanine carboxypeptidase
MMSKRGIAGLVASGRWRLGKWAGVAVVAITMLNSYPAMAAPAYEAIVLDAQTGQVLRELNPDIQTPPASLTKMMTLYLTFEALNQGRLRLDQYLRVSGEAASRAPSKLALVPGETVTVHDLILGIVTKSANDAAVVLAEALGGSEPAFAQQMNWKARQLGMNYTLYRNASGLPDPEQRTTARDIARLALALYHQFPREYRYFSTHEFVFRGQVMRNHNHRMEWYPGLDGIKTGFVNASGFNLAASAVRGNQRLIGVIMGGQSAGWRDRQMAGLLDQGFADLGGAQTVARPVIAAVPAATVAAAPVQMTTPVRTATAAPAAAQPNPAPLMASAAPQGDAAGAPAKAGVIGNALRHLAPVGKAEAAPLAREAPGGGEDWSIQLGAFRAEAAAQQALRQAAGVAAAKGKPHEILAPAKNDSSHLYRALLTRFTPKGAQAACAELHKKGIACTVVRPGAQKVASR